MIHIRNLTKQFNKITVLKNITLDLPDKGLVGIVGESGCGKTTLLNAITGLTDFEGDVEINYQSINRLSDEDRDYYRLINIGLIYQDYKLFNNDTVYNNVIFPLSLIEDITSVQVEQRTLKLLSKFGIKHKKNELVKNLSGGEKQRVAIARSLICDPKIIVADEPTGALDQDNSEKVFRLLKGIGKTRLVVVVSHNLDLVKRYADRIITLNNAVVESDLSLDENSVGDEERLPKPSRIRHQPHIKSRFLFRHYLSHQKERKYRQLFSILTVSICLLSIGIAFSLTTSVKSTIMRACEEYIDANNVVITTNEDNQIMYLESSEYEDVLDINALYRQEIYDVGTLYMNDFNAHFKTHNKFYISDGSTKAELTSLSASKINEYYWLDLAEETFYPKAPSYLKNDEIVLGLNLANIQAMCLFLKIERSVVSLSNYLRENDVLVVLDAMNDEWEYDNEEVFTLKAFCLTTKPCIYHYNHQWNRYIFEDRFRFPYTTQINTTPPYPWSLKRVHYLYVTNNRDDVIRELETNDILKSYYFEIAGHKYFPNRYDIDYPFKDINEILVFNNYSPTLTINDCSFIASSHNLAPGVIGTSGGYGIYPYSMMMGFSHMMFFASDEDELENCLNAYSRLSSKDIVMAESDSIMMGYCAKPKQNSVIFEIYDGFNANELSLEEVFISRGLYDYLFKHNVGNTLHISYCKSEKQLEEIYLREYLNASLSIKGIVEDSGYKIYHNSLWPILFFQCQLGVSTFELQPMALSLTTIDSSDAFVKELSRDFPQYQVVNPMIDISNSVTEVCDYISYALYAFSFIALMISIILLTLFNYLNILDIKKEIGLVRCIGVNKKEAQKMIFFPSIMSCLISFMLSSVELLLTFIAINYFMATSLNVGFAFAFSPMSLVMMFVIVILISLVSNYFIARKYYKLSPLESLKG